MILDEKLEFADAVSVAASAGTALIGDVIDLGSTSNYPANGEPLYIVIQTDTEIITAGSAGTIQFFLASDAQAAIATDGSATVHLSSASLVTDDAAANSAALNAGGTILMAALPMGTYERYLGVLCTTGTTTTTAGKINAFLTKDVARWMATADGI
jgi:hypothetical protein